MTTQLAMAHQMKGLKVGVLDVDLCGPSIPRMFGLQNSEVHQSEAGAFLKNNSTLIFKIFHSRLVSSVHRPESDHRSDEHRLPSQQPGEC